MTGSSSLRCLSVTRALGKREGLNNHIPACYQVGSPGPHISVPDQVRLGQTQPRAVAVDVAVASGSGRSAVAGEIVGGCGFGEPMPPACLLVCHVCFWLSTPFSRSFSPLSHFIPSPPVLAPLPPEPSTSRLYLT